MTTFPVPSNLIDYFYEHVTGDEYMFNKVWYPLDEADDMAAQFGGQCTRKAHDPERIMFIFKDDAQAALFKLSYL